MFYRRFRLFATALFFFIDLGLAAGAPELPHLDGAIPERYWCERSMVSDPILRALFFEYPLLSDTTDPRSSYLATLPLWEMGRTAWDPDHFPLRYFTVFHSEYFGEVEIQVFAGGVSVIIENPDVAEAGFLTPDQVSAFGIQPFDGDRSVLFEEMQRHASEKGYALIRQRQELIRQAAAAASQSAQSRFSYREHIFPKIPGSRAARIFLMGLPAERVTALFLHELFRQHH